MRKVCLHPLWAAANLHLLLMFCSCTFSVTTYSGQSACTKHFGHHMTLAFLVNAHRHELAALRPGPRQHNTNNCCCSAQTWLVSQAAKYCIHATQPNHNMIVVWHNVFFNIWSFAQDPCMCDLQSWTEQALCSSLVTTSMLQLKASR